MKNRPLTFKPELEEIIKKCVFCSLSMVDPDNKPYVLHMNFGYRDDYIYFHCAQKGKKIEVLKKNPNVCMAFSTDHDLRHVNEEVACSWAMRYRSVLAYGKVEFVEEYDEKVESLEIIMSQYSDDKYTFNRPAVLDVNVFKVKVEDIHGRAYGY
jgi:nitroimidazol reductase NimA-like FMN-containing flavoprotein (pyridoxamine 5'-phosphate oxidase superfamily)